MSGVCLSLPSQSGGEPFFNILFYFIFAWEQSFLQTELKNNSYLAKSVCSFAKEI